MTDEEINALAALAEEHIDLLDPEELDIWYRLDTMYRDAANLMYIKSLIGRLKQAEAKALEWEGNAGGIQAQYETEWKPKIDRLEADLADAYRALALVYDQYGHNTKDAPGHSHKISGVWDDDAGNAKNGTAGKPCEWCADWKHVRIVAEKARAFVEGEGK